jgi:tripeptide aminopeptidase
MSEINVDRLVNTFCELVKIPSESPNDQEFIAHVESLFKMMGGKTKKDDYGSLVAKFAAKNSKSTTAIAFVAHADTVSPGIGIEPVIADGKIKSKGDTILGADDKGAIAQMMEMIRTAEKHPPIEIIITRCEEPGSYGSVNLNYSMVDSKIAYVMDMNVPEEVVVGGPTLVVFNVTYKGRSAHAGMAPQKGISAVLAAAKAVTRLRLGKLDEETTANVGVFHGGEIRNGVPANANILAECRCLTHEKAMALADEMEKIFKQASDEVGTEVVVQKEVVLKAYHIEERSPAVQLKPVVQVIRGGTDATAFNAHGVEAVALGVGYRDIHSCEETAIIDEMVTMTKVIKTMVEDLA